MKTKTKITEITHEDLVELLSTATYGSSWLGIRRKVGDYKGTELEEEGDCLEDTWVKILLTGKFVYAYDFNAEDEEDFYGKLPHTWKEEKDAMRYELTLDDIRIGLQKCLDGTFKSCYTKREDIERERAYVRRCAMSFINYEDGDFDNPQAQTLLQVIMFGEEVYG